MTEKVREWVITPEMLDLYVEVREAMWPAARGGIRHCIHRTPDEVDVDQVVEKAFVEVWNDGLAAASSSARGRIAAGRARKRGIDRGRQINATTDKESGYVADLARVEDAASVEDSASAKEARRIRVQRCREQLTKGQRAVIAATVEGKRTLVEWASEQGVSHQACQQTRERALRALRKCMGATSEEAT